MNNSSKENLLLIGSTGDIATTIGLDLQADFNIIGISRNRLPNFSCKNYNLDLRNYQDLPKLIKIIVAENGPISYLVNAAGVLHSTPIVLQSEKMILEQLEVNVIAPIFIIKSILPNMVKQKHGRIINLSSMSTKIQMAGDSIYSSTKLALDNFIKFVNIEHSKFGVRANNLSISAIDNSFLRKATKNKSVDKIIQIIPHRNFVDSNTLKKSIRFLLSDDSLDIGGQTIFFGGVS